MTQIDINKLDIANMQTASSGSQNRHTGFDLTGIGKTSNKNNFNNILKKTSERNTPKTLGDIKENNTNRDVSDAKKYFKDVLTQATNEANMEKSLDLTLARDINEIIAQLKSAVNTEAAKSEQEEGGKTAEEQNEAAIIPYFEQILSASNINNTTMQTTTLDTSVESEKAELNPLKAMIKVEAEQEENSSENESGLDRDMLNDLNIESFETDDGYSNDNFLTNRQSPEELSLKAALNSDAEKFDISFEKAIKQTQTKTTEVTADKIIEQITKHFDSIKPSSRLNMVLNPVTLGKVNLQIFNTKDGLSAQFTVTTNEARDLLMKGLDGLKESLLAHGVGVDNISVKVSEPEEAYNPDWTEQESEGGNKGQEQQKREEKEKGLFEKTIAESLKNNNGNV